MKPKPLPVVTLDWIESVTAHAIRAGEVEPIDECSAVDVGRNALALLCGRDGKPLRDSAGRLRVLFLLRGKGGRLIAGSLKDTNLLARNGVLCCPICGGAFNSGKTHPEGSYCFQHKRRDVVHTLESLEHFVFKHRVAAMLSRDSAIEAVYVELALTPSLRPDVIASSAMYGEVLAVEGEMKPLQADDLLARLDALATDRLTANVAFGCRHYKVLSSALVKLGPAPRLLISTGRRALLWRRETEQICVALSVEQARKIGHDIPASLESTEESCAVAIWVPLSRCTVASDGALLMPTDVRLRQLGISAYPPEHLSPQRARASDLWRAMDRDCARYAAKKGAADSPMLWYTDVAPVTEPAPVTGTTGDINVAVRSGVVAKVPPPLSDDLCFRLLVGDGHGRDHLLTVQLPKGWKWMFERLVRPGRFVVVDGSLESRLPDISSCSLGDRLEAVRARREGGRVVLHVRGLQVCPTGSRPGRAKPARAPTSVRA